MKGYVDLHCHYLPAIDDGVRTLEEGVRLCTGLAAIGYDTVMATPHIHTAVYENRKPGLEAAFERFAELTQDVAHMPELGLGAEHFFDDVFWELFLAGEAVPYPGGKAILVELSPQSVPLFFEQSIFQMKVRGVQPVLAHPERHQAFMKDTGALQSMLDVGVFPLLDVMALVGKYGRHPKRAAERMLEQNVYVAVCTDCHSPADLDRAERGIARLTELMGDEEAHRLLAVNPTRILEGQVEW